MICPYMGSLGDTILHFCEILEVMDAKSLAIYNEKKNEMAEGLYRDDGAKDVIASLSEFPAAESSQSNDLVHTQSVNPRNKPRTPSKRMRLSARFKRWSLRTYCFACCRMLCLTLHIVVCAITQSLPNTVLTIPRITGHETTSTALTKSIQVLSQDSELQERLRSECAQANVAHAGADLDYDAIQSLPFLDAFVREVLRLCVCLLPSF